MLASCKPSSYLTLDQLAFHSGVTIHNVPGDKTRLLHLQKSVSLALRWFSFAYSLHGIKAHQVSKRCVCQGHDAVSGGVSAAVTASVINAIDDEKALNGLLDLD